MNYKLALIVSSIICFALAAFGETHAPWIPIGLGLFAASHI